MSDRKSVLLHDRHVEFLEEHESVNFSGLCRQVLDICIETESIVNTDNCEQATIQTASGEEFEITFEDEGDDSNTRVSRTEPEEENNS